MIELLHHKITIKPEEMGKYVISQSNKVGETTYFREPTKKEMIDKINELTNFINGKSNENRTYRS